MFHNPLAHRQTNRGFLIPVAAILVVGIGVLALAISRMTSQAGQSSIIEGISAQAFYAAESGAQYGMNRLMFNVSDRTVSDANCGSLGTTLNFSATGLAACSATISCSVGSVGGDPRSFYTIRSEGACGSGTMIAERIIEVSSSL